MIDTAALYKAHGAMVFRRARAVLGDADRARDVVQEVFMRLHANRDVMTTAGIVSWLYTATTHRCFNVLRNDKTRSRLLTRSAPAEPALQREPSAARVDLGALLPQLDLELASVAIYRFVDEMTHAEIAGQLGCSRRRVGDLLVRLEHLMARARAAS